MSVRAGIVVTGTEVLTGRITDRNGPWISERLEELGVDVAHIITVGDRPHDLEAALRFLAAEGVELVVTSGGLGPTADDLTAEVVGRFAGREMVLDEGMEERIAAILRSFARRLRFDPEALRVANRKQATIPEGATTIDPAGTAPGLVVPADSTVVIVLPGPPRELHAMWPQALATDAVGRVLSRAGEYRTSTMRLFGIPESELAKSLREIETEVDLSPLEITTCLRQAELVVDIRHRPEDEALSERVRRAIAERHGRFVFSDDGESVDDQVAQLLAGRRLALAESSTAGKLAARITDRPGASAYLAGGVVAYSNESKSELLGVPPELIVEHGAVSPQVAEAMADGALERFDADVACGITGIAGPEGGREEKPVGYVCFCVKESGGRKIARDPVLPGQRTDVRDRSVAVAMHMLRSLLRGEEPPL
ncbi:MAG TPA: competence/damage-inducible protein A [Solirubrobacterales bacterium]|jgi:nicotinamide-nucleotide amidase|nr:competence/damage-inducible protein A [Solirubrobacterales bacterium]